MWAVHILLECILVFKMVLLDTNIILKRPNGSLCCNLLSDIFTTRVAKRAKVMFSQVFVILSLNGGGNTNGQPPPPPGPGQNIYPFPPPRTRSEHLTPPGTRSEHLPPPRTRSEHLPPPPQDQVRTSTPHPRTRSEHLPPPPPLGDYTQAGGTPPTGMHSCLKISLCKCFFDIMFFYCCIFEIVKWSIFVFNF